MRRRSEYESAEDMTSGSYLNISHVSKSDKTGHRGVAYGEPVGGTKTGKAQSTALGGNSNVKVQNDGRDRKQYGEEREKQNGVSVENSEYEPMNVAKSDEHA